MLTFVWREFALERWRYERDQPVKPAIVEQPESFATTSLTR